MGGGTCNRPATLGAGARSPRGRGNPRVGLSPRGRGNLAQVSSRNGGAGLSPRGRGNRRNFRYAAVNRVWVYPRVGGGTHRYDVAILRVGQGLSPRGRGNLWSSSRRAVMPRVYPRVGGGTIPAITDLADAIGLSPRGRGNRSASSNWQSLRSATGLSPRGRGNRHDGLAPLPFQKWVYPRVGGGTGLILSACDYVHFLDGGLSPRGRGNRPATWEALLARVYPRVGGGTSPRCPNG